MDLDLNNYEKVSDIKKRIPFSDETIKRWIKKSKCRTFQAPGGKLFVHKSDWNTFFKSCFKSPK